MSKTVKWIIGIVVLLVIVFVGLSKAGVIGKEEGTKVSVEAVKNTTIIETVTASGKIYPEVEVKISPDVSGEIVELAVAEGDTVRKGQLLARIYADIIASQRDQAAAIVSQSEAQVSNSEQQLQALKATLAQAEAAYNRQKKLLEEKVISRQEFEVAEQAYNSAKANVKGAEQGIRANKANVQSAAASLSRAQKDVGRTTLIAPMDGVVSVLGVKKGERVAGNSFNVGTEMMRISDLGVIEAQVDVSENDIPKVSLGDSAFIEVDAYSGRKFKGIVSKIANPVTSLSATSTTSVTNYKVHIRLVASSYADLIVKGKPFPFRPNMTANAEIQTNVQPNIVTVPINAVTTREPDAKDSTKNASTAPEDKEAKEVVFVIQKDGTVKKVEVKTGIQDLNNIEIKTGVKVGEEVVTGPYDVVSKKLKDKMKVQVVKKEELFDDFKKN
ncbi:MAG: HlyD family efflux transporter periplasmic adaptor subunit [Bacteroidetes bacterium]|nr:MAG: HlyD family efflux transporter periplasmic adaptor subunit [Bacteroidota bacterium]